MTVLLVGCSGGVGLNCERYKLNPSASGLGEGTIQWNETVLAMEERHLQPGVGGHWKAFRIYGLESS